MNKKTIGIIGGGQLCLMFGEAIKNKNLPFKLISLDPVINCPANKFIKKQIIGNFKSKTKILQLSKQVNILTFEIESANSKILTKLKNQGKQIYPDPKILNLFQDKYKQSKFLKKHNLPIPKFQIINNFDDLKKTISNLGMPLMIKARNNSYDGRGNFLLENENQIAEVFKYFKTKKLMAQQFINFETEISIIAVRNNLGEIRTYPISENIHGKSYNILEKTIIPARINNLLAFKTKNLAKKIMKITNTVGVFGIEIFVYKNKLLINEIAPRVHNSGHFSIEMCKTSQFEQHINAITGKKLGDTNLISNFAIMYNLIGGENDYGNYKILYNTKVINNTTEKIDNTTTIHNYKKQIIKPNRKIGHITILSLKDETQKQLIKRGEQIMSKIKIKLI